MFRHYIPYGNTDKKSNHIPDQERLLLPIKSVPSLVLLPTQLATHSIFSSAPPRRRVSLQKPQDASKRSVVGTSEQIGVV